MPEYVVMIETYATAWVRVEVPEGSTRDQIMTTALEGELPQLCVGCTGGGGVSWDELELCDGWKPFKNHKGRYEIERVS